MSSLATAPRPAESRPARAPVWTGMRRLGITVDALLGLGLAGAIVLLAFLTTGGVDLAPNTWSQIVLTIVAAALGAAVLLLGARGRAWGAATLVLFAGLAALTFASIAWSVQPASSWLEANRTLSYLAAFAMAMAMARIAPGRWRALVGALATFATIISGYALLAKVFPATLDPIDQVARVSAPFHYFNATGLVAALGLPACVWAGARRDGGRVLRTLSIPAIALLVAVIVLSYSRGAVLAGVVGVGLWFALEPLRLRAALVLALGGAGGGAATAWALATPGITRDHLSLSARTAAGHEFGIVLLLVLAVGTIAGFAAATAMERIALPVAVRRKIGIGLITLVALVPIGAVAALAASSRGLPGEVSHIWTTLTDANSVVYDTPGRLGQLGSSRPRYWREGLKVGEHALLGGVGALGYATARTRYSSDSLPVVHAHSYVIETFADFGLIGLALSAALLSAWALAARRALTASAGRAREHLTERAGLSALLAIVVTFGLSSLIDWTWFIPGAAVPVMLCAGWLAGRGPLTDPVGRAQRRRRLSASPAAGAAVVAIVGIALAAGWVIWQPLRSADADASAVTALLRGNGRAALDDARTAAATNPVSVDPLAYLSEIYTAFGDLSSAHAELVKATSLQSANPATWIALARFDLSHRQPREALRALGPALRLDPTSTEVPPLIAQSRTELKRG